jgi:invasion protein IalB
MYLSNFNANKKHALILLIFSAALGYAGIGVSNAANPDDKVGEKFGDWISQCREIADGKTNCSLTQTLVARKTKQAIAQFLLSKHPKSQEVFLTAIVPLGIDIHSGVGFVIDESKPRQMIVKTCLSSGCIANFKIQKKEMLLLKKGVRLKLLFKPLSVNKPVILTGSLKGISAGIKAAKIE